ncbi:MAG: putative nucleic-acid-binding protein containing a Zn-ribbon domain [Idiomarinaceae bacterium HL-53]|nr:MAG: putative nucleic-acid-binding protein containing a Zn-ribbon domain [Idiomarinaceae bacterium HL-53]CUS47529.1 hypothetical protein Ga0003345_0462 [Idiomarinaceae bacterium HL-53]
MKKRFIAGATCPECKAQDSMMLYEEKGREIVRCVECDYQMKEPKAPEASAPDQVIGIFKP